MLIVVLIIGAVAVFGIVGWLLIFKTENDQTRAESNAAEILDTAFDGSPSVVFKTHMRTLKHETVMLGAKERGYVLTNQTLGEHGYGTLIFEKTV